MLHPRWSHALLPTADRQRRSLLCCAALAPLASYSVLLTSPAPAHASPEPPKPRLTRLAERLADLPEAFQRGSDGALERVFGLPAAEVGMLLYPVSRERAMPYGYQPPDLIGGLNHPLRALAVSAFRAMFGAAEKQQIYIDVVSGYRSAEYQAEVFENAVRTQLARNPGIERDEAERRASRAIAPPGHSQHQLGTTADLSTWEIGYGIRPAFAETAAGRWLLAHAWEFGFVFPYTTAAEGRTGYIAEPWHVRWVGRPLAALLWADDYLASSTLPADDYLLAVEQLLAARPDLPGARPS
jgi:hypothetical protein